MPSPGRRVATAVAVVVLTTACGGGYAPGDTAVVSCLVEGAAAQACTEYPDPLDDSRRLSIIAQCGEAGGRIVGTCPTERLVGVCEQVRDQVQPWTLSRTTRHHRYLHPDVATPEAVDALASRCRGAGVRWIPAVTD